MKKFPCKKCGALILPITAEKYDGHCVPCARSERPIGKFMAAVNKLFAPLFKWLNDGKPGGGCLMVPLVVASLVPASLVVMKSKRSKKNNAPVAGPHLNSPRLTFDGGHDAE